VRNRRNPGGEIVDVCRRLYAMGFVVATEGNVSVRLPSGDILVTATRVRKRTITTKDLVRLTAGGKRVSGAARASSEAALHRTIYAGRPDVHAVVHAHPPFCTAFAVARRTLPVGAIPETLVEFGDVPMVPFAVPGTGKLSRAIGPLLGKANFFLLANHGVVSCAADLEEAFDLVERAEHAARILLLARLAGGAKNLSRRDRAELLRIRKSRKDGQPHARTKA